MARTTVLAWLERQKSLNCFKYTSYGEAAEEYIFLLDICCQFRKFGQGIVFTVHQNLCRQHHTSPVIASSELSPLSLQVKIERKEDLPAPDGPIIEINAPLLNDPYRLSSIVEFEIGSVKVRFLQVMLIDIIKF